MRRAILVSTFLALPTFAQNPSTVGPTATVTIYVVDADGKSLDDCRVARFVRQDPMNVRRHDLDMTSHFDGLHGTEIPFGTYFCTIKRKLGNGREGSGGGIISVSRLDAFSVFQADFGLLYGMSADGFQPPDRNGIKGRIEPPPGLAQSNAEPIWIHLSPVYAGEQFDVAVNPAGEFRIYNALPGLYTLTVIQAGRVIHMQPIEFRHVSLAQPLVVRIPKNPPQVLDVHESIGNINEDTRN